AAAGLASGETADGAGLDRVAWTPAVSSLRDVSCVTRVGDVAVEWPSASLACGSISHMAQPAMAMAGSTASRASDFPNDHPAILIAVPSPVPRMKKPYGRFPYCFCHDHRCTDPAARQQSPKAEMVSCHLDNIAAAARPGWNCGCPAATLAAPQPASAPQQQQWRDRRCRTLSGTMSICAVPIPRRPPHGWKTF